MSDTQIPADQDIKMDEIENKNTENTKAEPDVDEDLEDGEIDDDDEDEDVVITSITNNIKELNDNHTQKLSTALNEKIKITNDDVVTIDLLDDSGQPPSPNAKPAKSKKPKPLEDDFASSIENALANALKKKGIDPVLPVLDTRNGQGEQQELQQSSSRSSRRRKRKKQREEKEKRKGSSERKKTRYESPDSIKAKILELEDDDLMEDYEMLNVRGGSPPPISHISHPIMPQYKDQYDSVDDSSYSYDSYDSGNDADSPSENRRRRRNKKEKDSRKRRGGRNRDGDRQDKNNRRGESPDRQEPRKLELCKFYLMECCAKRDKCSYMHADFPCKYYYLGMECPLKDDCKFSHGEPLSEQLRNILLKHLETAPKEILGNFKRISREQSIAQMTKRHEELCQKFNVQNIWSPFPNIPLNHNRRGGNNNDHQHQNQQQYNNQISQQQQQHQPQQQQMQLLQQQQQQPPNSIPSLLDLDIRPPLGDLTDLSKNSGNTVTHDKQRKTRWCDNTTNDIAPLNNRPNLEPPPNNAPSYLDLKNLTGILSEEHIKQLSDIGIINLEQVNQLTVGQLNQIGLTVAEINEIQLNAKNMAKLGVQIAGNSTIKPAAIDIGTTANQTDKASPKTDKSSSLLNYGEKLNEETASSVTKASLPDENTNSNSNSNSGVIMVDYSQYLKDSHLPFERGDDDERDDEQLIIDDGNTDNDESQFGTPIKSGHGDSKKRKDSFSDNEQQHQQPLSSLHKLHMPNFTNALRNPFSSIPAINKQSNDPRLGSQKQNDQDVFKSNQKEVLTSQKKPIAVDTDSDDECYYASRGRRSRSVTPTRSGGSSTPEGSPSPTTDDFGGGSKPRVCPKYDRNTMYDYDVKRVLEEDAAHAAKSMKADKDMRFMEGRSVSSGDIDLRLPFLPVTNYTPATEIDGSITSHLPMTYKVYEVDVKPPSYVELRKNCKSDQTSDPRLRRILGLPETPTTRTTVELSRSVRKLSNTIASPESSDGASPKYYTPSMSSNTTEERVRRNSHTRTGEHTAQVSSAAPQLRLDPRRAARQAAEASASSSAQNSPPITGAPPNNANKQNVEIRNYLQKSEWYKNLNSKFKIMVNQQLALVSTELKKFHQDPSPNKIFDISFIVNNSTLQQILTNLGVYIDDNGEVAHIDGDSDETEQTSQDANSKIGAVNSNIVLPNLSQPPPTQSQPQQQLDFLRAPPPNMFGQSMNMQNFPAPPPNPRPSLLGLPPCAPSAPRNPFNPFAGNVPVPFAGAQSLLGPGPGAVPGLNAPIGFGNFGVPQNMQQKRNFGNGRNNQQRNQRQRRNNFNGPNAGNNI